MKHKTDHEQVDALYECCEAFYKNRGEDGKTVSCPKPSMLRHDAFILQAEAMSPNIQLD